MLIKGLKQAIRQLYPKRTPVARVREELMHEIAIIGGRLFGPAKYNERLFYVRDRKTVVWKEGELTTYYQVTPNGVMKTQTGQPTQRISDLEARRLLQAVQWYGHSAVQYLQNFVTQ